MTRLTKFLVTTVAALAVLVPAGRASAAEITFVSVVGTWRDPVDNLPGSQPGDPVITNGNPTSSISWGDTTGDQSGYDFTSSLPPPFELPGAIPFFSLGDFTHRNFSVNDPSLVSVELDVELVIAIDGVITGPLMFSFTLNHEETPNNLDPCPYPTPPGEGCTDRVTIVASAEPTTFNVDGVDYTLDMSFLNNGSPVDEFITREGDTVNSSGLVGDFTLPPGLSVTKTGPATLRQAEWGNFTLGVQNESEADAYYVTLLDRLPDGPTGGMCDAQPEILSVQVFGSDGVTPIPGKGPLVEGTDYTVTWNAGSCELTLNTVTAPSSPAVIGIGERLMLAYRARLDADTQDSVTLTNVAGATRWLNADGSTEYLRTLTDGTPGVGDHEDSHSVDVGLALLQFEKVVVNVTSGEDPGTVANPGDTLRYRLYVENLGDVAVDDFRFVDDLDRLNAIPMFQPGTLNVVTLPAGADASLTNATGGTAGTGLLDVRNLSIGGLGETLLVEFEVQLAPVIDDGAFVYNQSEMYFDDFLDSVSDDPNINGAADPLIDGDEDPTQILIESAPLLDIDKISSYITGNPNVLLAGETLRYTITVTNIGTDDASSVSMVDAIPTNTYYVADSTTLNGVPVADVNGSSALVDGILLNAPQDTTPGVLNAGVADNTATIVFDVLVDPNVQDGTIISNQAFVSAPDNGFADLPSDDPRTPLVDDPTRDVVGNFPLLFAPKTATLQIDNGSPGIVDPGDVLRYTIQVYNNGTVPTTYTTLQDAVPANTSYVADSVTLNGLPLGQPDGGISPLIDGIDISSADLTPPLPGVGEGVLNPGQSAVVQFDLLVDAAVLSGTLITNQATVDSVEVPTVLTDGDGNPATGPEPTIVVVGDAQQLSIAKSVAVVGGGPVQPGAELEYTVTVTNVASVSALYVAITDDLDEVTPGYLTYVADSATLNGSSDGISVAGNVITADYFNQYGPLLTNGTVTLRFRATVDPGLAIGTTVTNRGRVQWNDPLQYLEAEVSVDIGGTPGSGTLSGQAFRDVDHDGSVDAGERLLEGWTVELLRDGDPISTVQTDVEGGWAIAGVMPNYLNGVAYSIRYTAPGAGSNTAQMGVTDSDFTDGLQQITDIVVQGGSLLRALNMPIDPNGVVYDSLARQPVAGVTVRLTDPVSGQPLPDACFDDPNQATQVTLGEGWYRFDLNFSDPACPSGGSYLLDVSTPGDYYVAGPSELIPAAADLTTLPFNVPNCPGSIDDALPGTALFCEASPSEDSPPTGVDPQSAGAAWYAHLTFDNSATPGSSQIFNNHIPVDPDLSGVVSVTKTTPLLNVNRGQLVPYVITVNNTFGLDLSDIIVVDRFPAGFKYVEGSAMYDGVPTEPALVGGELAWSDLTLTAGGTNTIRLLLAVGAGVAEGEFVNRAQVLSGLTGGALSEEASATVRIVPDPTFDCTDVTGKVYQDTNLNGYQDLDENGIAGARVVTTRGLAATTDQFGRYHITCAIVPHEFRGSNFVLKLDDRSLPSGFRPTTRPVQVQRATRGKALKLNFGATIHRVVGMDLSDPVFVPGQVEIRPQWAHRLDMLVTELSKAPSVLRLAYVADVEEEALVEARMNAIQKRIRRQWKTLDAYDLTIEPEIFWRLGGPPDVPKVKKQ